MAHYYDIFYEPRALSVLCCMATVFHKN